MCPERQLFICVTYNDFTNCDDFCRSLQAQERKHSFDFRCVIVDNSIDTAISTQLRELENRYPFVQLLHVGKNLGYFGAMNYALTHVEIQSFDQIILCNNDLLFDSHFCENLAAAHYSEDTMVVCPDVITLDGIHQNPHVLRPLSFAGRLKLDLYFSHYYVAVALQAIKDWGRLLCPWKSGRRTANPQPCFLHMGIGACYVLRKTFLKKFSRLDFPFFLYGEEAFLTAQVHAAQGRLFLDPSLKVQHKESATCSKMPKREMYEYAREGYPTYRKLY